MIMVMASRSGGSSSSTLNNMANNSFSWSLTGSSSQYAYRDNADCVDLGESGGTDPNLIMAWVKPTSTSHMVICSHTTGFDDASDMPDGGFEFSITSDGSGGYKPYVWLYQFRGTPPNFNPQIFTTTGTGPTTGSWHHLAFYAYGVFPYTSSDVRFYIDGSYVETINNSNSGSFDSSGGAYSQVNSAKFMAGAVFGEDTSIYGCWDGGIDELILARVSSTTEADTFVSTYYQSCAVPQGNGNFLFNNNYLDSSGNGNTLTPVNSPTFSPNRPFTCFVPQVMII